MKGCGFSGKKLILATAMFAATALATAQETYPSKIIKIMVGVPAGGGIDTTARILAEVLSKELKQTVIVENKTGASGMIAAATVAKSAPDGHTLLITNTSILQNDILQKDAQYRLSDLAPVAETTYIPVTFGVASSVPVNTLAEFVVLAKEKPGTLSYGSYGKGTSAHIWGEQLAQEAGIKLNHVPYRGEIPAINDLVAGHITAAFGSAGTYKQFEDSKKVRILATTGPTRSKVVPHVPTFVEAGYPAMDTGGWTGIFVPANTPKPIVQKLSDLLVKAIHTPDVASRILQTGLEPTGTGHEQFSKTVARDRAAWSKLIDRFRTAIE